MKVSSKEHSNLGTSDNTTGVTIDADLAAQYNPRVVEYALKLKAKNGNKYSDEFYLEYARNIDLQEMNGKYGLGLAQMAAACPIQDSDWAGYSYEEILQMENNGYKIPEEVLLWAHAQQESDVTAYEVITGSVETDDSSSTDEVTGDFDLNNLQKKAKEYTTKSEKAEEQAQKNLEEFNTLKAKASKIKQEKENTYQDSMKEITNLTNEWKKLDEKSKNGSLSASERKRYQDLSRMLGNESSIMDDIQVDSKDLDDLLSSMNLLMTGANDNITLANDTIKAANDLAGFQVNYNSEQKTYNTSGIVYSNSGLLTDLLYGAPGSTIQRIALDAGTELAQQSDDIITDMNTPESTELNQFATEYTTEAKRVQENVKSVNGNNDESKKMQVQDENSTQNAATNSAVNQPVQQVNKNSQNSDNTSNVSKSTGNKDTEVSNGGKNPNFFVLPLGGRPELALLATTTSIISTANLRNKQKDVNNTEKKLKKDLQKTNKEVQKVSRDADRIEKKHAEFVQRADAYSAQLEMLVAAEEEKQLAAQQEMEKKAQKQAGSNSVASQNPVNGQNNAANTTVAAGTMANMQGVNSTQEEETEQQTPEQSPEIDAVMKQLNYLSSADQQIMASLVKPIAKAKSSVAANQKSAKSLKAQNASLDERNSNNKKVQRNTIICGGMTTAMGAYNMAVAVPLLHTGIAMSSFPPTAATGAALVAFATKWIIIASLQLSLGPGAIASGTVGLVASGDVSDDIKEHDKTYADVLKASNANNKALRLANNVVTQSEQIVAPDPANSGPKFQKNNTSDNIMNSDLSTSRTEVMTFKDIKDINNIPQGPTNLSNPLNDTKKSSQNSNEPIQNDTTSNSNQVNETVKASTSGISRTSATTSAENKQQKTFTIQKNEANTTGANNYVNQSNIGARENAAESISAQQVNALQNNGIQSSTAQIQQNSLATGRTQAVAKVGAAKPTNIAFAASQSASDKNQKSSEVMQLTTQETNTTLTTGETSTTQETNTTSTTGETSTTQETNTTLTTGETSTTQETNTTSTTGETSTTQETNTTLTTGETSTTQETNTTSTTGETSTTQEENVEEIAKQENTKIIAQDTKTSQENLAEQINSLENANQTAADNSEKVDEILKNNMTKLSSLQQQFENLNSSIQNANPDEVTDEINPVKAELESGSDRINTIITNNNNRINMISQPEEEVLGVDDNIDIETQDTSNEVPAVVNEEDDETSEDTNILAASASTNANVNATTITDDKADRKLSRFNMDSIIESKKKKKKVLAVSAAKGGKA